MPSMLRGAAAITEEVTRRGLEQAQHAVIVVAEGAGQHLLEGLAPVAHDAAGNVKLEDVGLFLKTQIQEHFNTKGIPHALNKSIDPSYIVRSIRAM